MKLVFGNRFEDHLRARIRGYSIEVGILKDSDHYEAVDKEFGLTSYAGGAVRKESAVSNKTLSQVSHDFSQIIGLNYLTEPFRSKRNKDILRLAESFIPLMINAQGKTKNLKRIENLAQAIVRNPLLRGDYGKNSKNWAKEKGFNRLGFDTGQLFKAIKAKVKFEQGTK